LVTDRIGIDKAELLHIAQINVIDDMLAKIAAQDIRTLLADSVMILTVLPSARRRRACSRARRAICELKPPQ
ncbi:hypothetical protein, partial [Stenotrophomonas maltophilia]|uniref:hypothetical protein n=1 Tax=Stenotrophomonas maltophilia TaxID=40324 RepID=UPI001953C37F